MTSVITERGDPFAWTTLDDLRWSEQNDPLWSTQITDDVLGKALAHLKHDRSQTLPETEKHDTGALKETAGKLRMDLIPPEVEKAYAEVLTMGAAKYSDRNFEKGLLLVKHHLGAARRHINKWQLKIDNDEESGLNHMKHALFHIAAIVMQIERGRNDLDDR